MSGSNFFEALPQARRSRQGVPAPQMSTRVVVSTARLQLPIATSIIFRISYPTWSYRQQRASITQSPHRRNHGRKGC